MKRYLFLLTITVIFLSLFVAWRGGSFPQAQAQACSGSPPACPPIVEWCGVGFSQWDWGYVDYLPLTSCGGVVDRLIDRYWCEAAANMYCESYYQAQCTGGVWTCEFDFQIFDHYENDPGSCVKDPSIFAPYCGLPDLNACLSCGGVPVSCTPTAPSTPTLTAPADGATVAPAGTALDWNAVTSWGEGCGGGNEYKVYLENGDSTPDILVARYTQASGATVHATGALTSGATYYWQVVADNGSMAGSSAVRSFTVSAGSACSANTPYASWTDDPIVAGETFIRAAHFTEMRARINERRAGITPAGTLPAQTWPLGGPIAAGGFIRAAQIEEMRTAIEDVYTACGQTLPVWADDPLVANTTKIRKIHIDELRDAIDGAPKKP